MELQKKIVKIALVFMIVIPIILSLSFFGCSKPFPYQGSYTGNWTGKLTVLTRDISVGGTITITVDSKGVGTGSAATTGGTIAPATMKAQVDSNGSLTGTVSFTIMGTEYNSNWQGKITGSGSSLNMQGTWTSDHGSGTFTATGSK
jgi:hypothetical protein